MQQKLPFVSFSKPNARLLKGYFGKNASLRYSDSFKEKGFVFAPFDNESPAIIFSQSSFEIIQETCKPFVLNFSKKYYEDLSSEMEDHIELVKRGIHAIQKNDLEKVV